MDRLMVWAGKIRDWFQGKKTMLGGLLLIGAGVVGVAAGKLPVDQGVIVVGFGLSICGWSAKANRHQAELLAALQAAAVAGIQLRAGNKAGAVDILEQAVLTAAKASVIADKFTGNADDMAKGLAALTSPATTGVTA